MTNKERKYMRSAYHHFDERHIRNTNTPHPGELAQEWRKFKDFSQIVYHILCLKSDIDGQSEELLKELFDKHKIKIME